MHPRSERDELINHGKRQAWTAMLRSCLRALGYEGVTIHALIVERESITAALRRVCKKYGSDTWADDEPLAEVIASHLERHLDAKLQPAANTEPATEPQKRQALLPA